MLACECRWGDAIYAEDPDNERYYIFINEVTPSRHSVCTHTLLLQLTSPSQQQHFGQSGTRSYADLDTHSCRSMCTLMMTAPHIRT